MKRLAVVLLVAAAFMSAGCLDIEETLALNRDMSGQAGFTMSVDMEPVVGFMAQMQRQMAGESGPPTADELAAARAEFLKSTDAQTAFDKDKKDLETHLPPGVKLLNSTYKQDGLKSSASALLSFQDAAGLQHILLDQPSDQSQASQGPENPVAQPFGGLTVVDDGRTVLITSPVVDPMSNAKSQMTQMPMDAALQKQFADMFKGMRVVVKISAPFTVLEQNATRKEGSTLVWEYDAAQLEAMTADQLKGGIRVRYQK